MNLLEIIPTYIIVFCVFFILSAVLIDFLEFDKKDATKQKQKSPVATGTMLLFFLVFYLAIKFEIGEMKIESYFVNNIAIILGLALIMIGTFVNIKARFDLGRNWANHIKIYKDHALVRSGMYKIVRHPLYASLMWAFYGASFAYLNWAAFLLNTFIFIPIMYYRAKQEEALLEKEFPEYNEYKIKTGMFFPKI